MVDSCDDPCDDVTTNDLTGWIHNDGRGSLQKDSGQRLERREGSGYTNSWTRNEHG